MLVGRSRAEPWEPRRGDMFRPKAAGQKASRIIEFEQELSTGIEIP